MRILPIANNQVQSQNNNLNFGSMSVLLKDIENFKKICPDTVSLSDSIRSRVHDYNTGIIKNLIDGIAGITGNSKTFPSPFMDIFIDTKTEYPEFEALATAAMEEIEGVEGLRSDAFRDRWDNGIGNVGKLKDKILAFTLDSDAATSEQIEAFLPLVQATQDIFIKECGKK